MQVQESAVRTLNRPAGELTFATDGNAIVGDVVEYKGVAFKITETFMDESTDPPTPLAKAEVARVENLPDVEPFALTLNPGDLVVIMSERALTQDQTKAIRDRVTKLLPGYTVMVLDSALRIGKVERAPA